MCKTLKGQQVDREMAKLAGMAVEGMALMTAGGQSSIETIQGLEKHGYSGCQDCNCKEDQR